jgi:hypothetical protein
MDIIDQYNGDATLTRLYAALEDRPRALEAIKNASFEPDDAARLPDSAFAWDGERRFAIHTREDAIASIAYRAKFAGHVPRFVDERLSDAAEAYGIDDALFQSTTPKLAAAPVEYAVPSENRLPLGTAAQVKIAEEVLIRDGHKLPLVERVEAFAKVAGCAAALGVETQPETGTYAGLNHCNRHVLCDRIGMRAATTKVAGMADMFDKLEAGLAHLPEIIYDRDTLLKLAGRIEELDTLAGLQPHYGKRVFDPMKTVFNGGEKIAKATEWTSDGMDVTRLMNLPEHVWDQVDVPEMGKLAQEGNNLRFKQAYETLPLDIKLVLKRQMGR